jgi:hypothetical protein
MKSKEFIDLAIKMLIPFFETYEQAEKWLYVKNPNFGYISPIEMFNIGKADKVLEFINNASNSWNL